MAQINGYLLVSKDETECYFTTNLKKAKTKSSQLETGYRVFEWMAISYPNWGGFIEYNDKGDVVLYDGKQINHNKTHEAYNFLKIAEWDSRIKKPRCIQMKNVFQVLRRML